MKILPKNSNLGVMFEIGGKTSSVIMTKCLWDWEVTSFIEHPTNANMNFILAWIPQENMSILFDSHDVITT